MSLATAGVGGGMGGGGLTMAHHAAGAQHNAAPPPPDTSHMSGAGPIFMGADLTDKNQGLSLKQVKNVSHLPLVGIDLHSSEPLVAYFPPKPDDPSGGATPMLVGKMKSALYLKSNETAHKTVKKYLAMSKTFRSLQTDALSVPSDKEAVVISKPHVWLGLRRINDAPKSVRDQLNVSSDTVTHAIAEEVPRGVGAALVNSTLDGSESSGDDFDRVVWKVRLCDSKKAFPILPEEAVQALLRQAQYHVAVKCNEDLESEEIIDYPLAISLPTWAFHDAAVDALLEATDNSAVIVPRSVAALAGALLPPPPNGGSPSPLLTRILTVRKNSKQEFQKVLAQNPEAIWEDEITLIMVGMTEEGLETTAIQVSSENGQNVCAIFGDFKVISNVSYQDSDPVSQLKRCALELEKEVDRIAPEADGPTGIVFFGSQIEQDDLKSEWENIKSSLSEWISVPVYNTKQDTVALGTAVLGGVSHGRSTRIRAAGSKKTKPELALQVQNVAPMAVGIRMFYHGKISPSKWSSIPVKTIFDFDRRVPAGPFPIELIASECAVYREHGADKLSEEDFLKATKEMEGVKGIPKREEAALDLRVQIVQKWSRDGEWKQVGDVMQPLVKVTERDDKTDTSKVEAVESVTLELSLGVNGIITSNLVGERQSVVQATKSAFQSTMRYYIGIIVAILFFGGFMVRSYYEEYAFKRDVKRLLAYYKHVIPGSISDGDENNARYLVWKYRNQKEKLWKTLEKKYGEPVLYPDEWEAKTKEESEADVMNLDEDSDKDKEATGTGDNPTDEL
ncbi:hypothetical protein FisN_4Lh416 [Fistulifera solaris]|uniref:Uncharacterized protein n=1 Tax=Fistulifera solaris TaxID=1519565 RepID=A0A1Z5KDC5_FISSO|nr:hypothetical protein FisN_4Lh416 [Fistulifera solaris]|eukprot:GAX24304.1 hypothetical protein FisN_4Lh416 [Fistulifera solaris]